MKHIQAVAQLAAADQALRKRWRVKADADSGVGELDPNASDEKNKSELNQFAEDQFSFPISVSDLDRSLPSGRVG